MAGVSSATSYTNRSTLFTGTGKVGSFITGAITRADGSPVRVTVELYDQNTRQLLEAVLSSAAGEWEIDNLDIGRFYYARIKDPLGQLNGAVLDWIQPVPMT